METDVAAPAPEHCLHNLHRRPDDDSAPPEPTQFCDNAIGVFHMIDCPLFLGRSCTYFERAEEPHPTTPDATLDLATDRLHVDFLSWKYRRRVRALAHPEGWLPEPQGVEAVPDPVEEAEPEDGAEIELRAPVVEPEPEEESAPPASTRPEMYPGQRRSEDRTRRRAPAKPQEDDAPDDEDDTPEPPPPPRTVEEILAATPEARLPDKPKARSRRRGPAGEAAGGRGEGGGGGRGGSGRRRGGGRGPRSPSTGGGPTGGAKSPEGAGEKSGSKSGSASGSRRRGRRRGPKKPAGADGRTAPPRDSSQGGGGSSKDGPPKDGAARPRRRRRRGRRPGGGGEGGSGGAPPAPAGPAA